MIRRISTILIKYFLIVSVFSLVGITTASAEDWPTILKKAKAKQEKYTKEIKDITSEQVMTINAQGREMTAQSKMYKKGVKYRMETTMKIPEMPKEMGDLKTIMIHDGTDTWSISSMMGKKKMAPGEDTPFRMGSDWWGFMPEEAEVVGSEKIGDRDCHIIAMTEDDDNVFSKAWVDKKSLLMIKAETKGPRGGTMMMIFSEFKKIKGDWEAPYKTEAFEDDKLLTSIIVKSIEVNTGLSDTLFDPEKAEVKGPSMEEMMKKMGQKQGG